MAELRPGRVATQKAPPFHSIHLLQEGEICDSAAAKTHLISPRSLVSCCALPVLSVFGNCNDLDHVVLFLQIFLPFFVASSSAFVFKKKQKLSKLLIQTKSLWL